MVYFVENHHPIPKSVSIFSYANAKELLNCLTFNIHEYTWIYILVFLVAVHCLHKGKGTEMLIGQNVKFDQ